MDKLTLAHDYYMAHVKSGTLVSEGEAWDYADNMFYEMDLRKDKTLPDALWQPDWSLAPYGFNYFIKQDNGMKYFINENPVLGEVWMATIDCEWFEVHLDCPVDWRDSLRIRPQGK